MTVAQSKRVVIAQMAKWADRRWPNVIARFWPSEGRLIEELMSVQPMSEPSGQVFYLDFRYATDQ